MGIESYDKTGGYNPNKLKWDDSVSFPSTRKLKEYGNRVYNRYPARSIFLVPRATIFHNLKDRPLNLLDPFMGSGTSAVEASIFGCHIYGTEMDPFARLIAEASILRFNDDEITQLKALFNEINNNWGTTTANSLLYPNLKNIEYWFNEDIFQDLLKLKTYLYNNINNEKFLKFFKVVFADCIKPSSKMERQSTKPYISSKFKKVIKPVSNSFEYSFNAHLLAIKQYNEIDPKQNFSTGINWIGYDATNFNGINNIIDIAITSPPYLNAFDYTQVIKIESAWVGTLVDSDIAILRTKQVGHEKRKENESHIDVINIFQEYYNELLLIEKIKKKSSNQDVANTCLSYFNDIYNNLCCVKAALTMGGEYHMVIGDNVINSIEIPTHKIIAKLAVKIGFKWTGYYKYPIKDHRTSIPRNENGGKINYEYVIILKNDL